MDGVRWAARLACDPVYSRLQPHMLEAAALSSNPVCSRPQACVQAAAPCTQAATPPEQVRAGCAVRRGTIASLCSKTAR